MKASWLFLLLTFVIFSVDHAVGLAAKKNNKGKGNRRAAASNKGFGVAPAEVFADVLSSFKSRFPADADSLPCPCGSGDIYGKCCGPYHRGEIFPESATKVLRSRYTAFTWRLIPYVIDSTHPTCRDYRENRITWAKDLNKSGMFDSFRFISLEFGPEIPGKNDKEAFIEFKVRLRATEDSGETLEGQETVIGEKSRFLCDEEGKWKYSTGDVHSEVEGLEGTILNR
mmetsp:Transcript_2306/g.3370  ORF Transcript_2306/g.3370 Transcript_2306/m.3370 type:complete len:227 (+) Transcript_2306:91-771(+)